MKDTHPQLAAMKARADQATRGPWCIVTSRDVLSAVIAPSVATIGNDFERDEDAEFIAHARTDVPRMIALAEAVMDECNSVINDKLMLHDARRCAQTILDIINRELAK